LRFRTCSWCRCLRTRNRSWATYSLLSNFWLWKRWSVYHRLRSGLLPTWHLFIDCWIYYWLHVIFYDELDLRNCWLYCDNRTFQFTAQISNLIRLNKLVHFVKTAFQMISFLQFCLLVFCILSLKNKLILLFALKCNAVISVHWATNFW